MPTQSSILLDGAFLCAIHAEATLAPLRCGAMLCTGRILPEKAAMQSNMRVLTGQAANQFFICIMEYLTIPSDIRSLTAHTQTGDESDCNVTALQLFTEGC